MTYLGRPESFKVTLFDKNEITEFEVRHHTVLIKYYLVCIVFGASINFVDKSEGGSSKGLSTKGGGIYSVNPYF